MGHTLTPVPPRRQRSPRDQLTNPVNIRSDVQLMRLGLDHAGNMARWMEDPAVRDNIGLRSEPSLERTQEWIARALADETVCAFAILAAGQHVGNVVLDRIDRHLQTARLSIYIGEGRGGGAGKAATLLAARHGFDTLGLNKIWLTVHAQNGMAIRVYQQLGFTVEGFLRQEFVLAGQRIDVLYMGLLASEMAPPA
jgi:diamine N-acetyltransferase